MKYLIIITINLKKANGKKISDKKAKQHIDEWVEYWASIAEELGLTAAIACIEDNTNLEYDEMSAKLVCVETMQEITLV